MDLQLTWKNFKNINSFGLALYVEISVDLPLTWLNYRNYK